MQSVFFPMMFNGGKNEREPKRWKRKPLVKLNKKQSAKKIWALFDPKGKIVQREGVYPGNYILDGKTKVDTIRLVEVEQFKLTNKEEKELDNLHRLDIPDEDMEALIILGYSIRKVTITEGW